MSLYSQVIVRNDSEALNTISYCIKLLDSAIFHDKGYHQAYFNKSNLLIRLHKYEKAIEVLNKLENLETFSAESAMLQGNLYEKMGNKDNAIDNYQKAINIYDRRIYKDEKEWNEVDQKIAKFTTLLFLEDKYTVLDSLRTLEEKYPDDIRLKNMRDMVYDFDKDEYLSQF